MATDIRTTRDVFLWCMSVIYLFAFASLFVQIPGLYGDKGILPAKLVLEHEAESFSDLVTGQPTLLRLLPHVGLDVQTGMDFLCFGGALLAFVAMVSRDQRNCVVFAVLWTFYLSLFHVGQTLLWFQWDALLLEVGFLTILVAPLNFFGLHDAVWHHSHDHVTFWLVRWLLFRLTFASGLVKLTSNSDSWWSLSELANHYETQELPTPLAWHFHRFPEWLHRLCAVGVLVTQIGISLLFLSPAKNQRIFAFYSQVVLLSLMTLTGNYGFYTLLTLTLCLSLVDDDWLNSWSGHQLKLDHSYQGHYGLSFGKWHRPLTYLFSAVTYGVLIYGTVRYFGLQLLTSPFRVESDIAFSADDLTSFVHVAVPLSMLAGAVSLVWTVASSVLCSYRNRKLNQSKRTTEVTGCIVLGLAAFGVFTLSLVPHASIDGDTAAVVPKALTDVHMWTTKNYQLTSPYTFFRKIDDHPNGRLEVIIEGSSNLEDGWKEYKFRFKPGGVSDRLPIVSPHQPRLDWQMWFAARSHYDENYWLLNLAYRLLNSQKEVLELMGENPFLSEPPKYIRASLYRYRFSSNDRTDERYSEGVWWAREYAGQYLPILSMDDPSFINYLQQAGIYYMTADEETVQNGGRGWLHRTISGLRSLLGQGNGSSACLTLVVTGFLLTLLDPSIGLFCSQPLVDGAAMYEVNGK